MYIAFSDKYHVYAFEKYLKSVSGIAFGRIWRIQLADSLYRALYLNDRLIK